MCGRNIHVVSEDFRFWWVRGGLEDSKNAYIYIYVCIYICISKHMYSHMARAMDSLHVRVGACLHDCVRASCLLPW